VFSNTPFIVEAVIGFSLLIFVHELGHFLAAKFCGVRVEVFSLGFGPPLLRKRLGATEYRISLIQLGGYVKMAGEEPQPGRSPQPGDFYAKPVGQRALVFGAGVGMSLVFGFLIFILAYRVGVPVMPAVVGQVHPGSPAWKAGLRRGDRILKIDDISPPIDFEDLRTTIALAAPGRGIRLEVARGGKTFGCLLHPQYEPRAGLQMAGIYEPVTMVVGEPAGPGRDSPEQEAVQDVFKAGLKPGDTVTAVELSDGQFIPVATPQEFQDAVDQSGGQPVRIHFSRGGKDMPPLAVRPRPLGPPRWLGVRFGSNVVEAVRPGSWAEGVGFAEGDEVVAVGGEPCSSRGGVIRLLDAARGREVVVRVRRDAEVLNLSVPPRPAGSSVEDAVAFVTDLVVDSCLPGYPAQRAGMRSGDRIVAADGKRVTDAVELARILGEAEGRPVKVAWMRGDSRMEATIVPQRRWVVQVPFKPLQDVVRAGFLGSCRLGARKTYQWIVRVYATLKGLVSGRLSVRHLSGPLAIGYFTYAAARRGFGTLLYILGVLSVNLGVLNLLPIPVLDGGHLLFAFLEKARGRPVSERIRAAASYVGLSVLGAVILLAFWNDIRSLFFG